MRILTRYILGEVLSHTLLGLFLFTFVLFMPNLVQIVELVVQDGASMSSVTVFYGTGSQHQDYTAEVVHEAPHTRSAILARGVMGDRARSVFTGQSVIKKGAVGSDARQKEQTLMLSDQARADAIPSLQIDDNDVFAAHSASAGPVDPTMLYYLESRGLEPEEARRVVIRGFLEPVLASLAPASVQERVRELVETKLGGES